MGCSDFQCLHFTFQAGNIGGFCAVTFIEEKYGPEQDKTNPCFTASPVAAESWRPAAAAALYETRTASSLRAAHESELYAEGDT
ncbi:hypothetical protein HGG75_06270 [Ochrobactrum pseudogrignonense]|nr:hypothetical protein [Brucella pseudogrignonensis]